MRTRMIQKIVFLIALSGVGCGTNIAESLVEADPVDAALIYLEQDDPDAAIKLLEKVVADDPTDYEAKSILALAIGQKYGLEPLDFALRLASQSNTASDNGLVSLMAALPTASDSNIAGLQLAVGHMEAIPANVRTTADEFKLSMFQTALLTLMMKKFDADLNGEFGADELASLSNEDAATVINMLANAVLSSEAGAEGESSIGAASQLAQIQSSIESQDGATDADKLKNYLGGA